VTRSATLPRLPRLVEQKLVKTGYTRGATLKEIYQNRVTRNNPVLIPWGAWDRCKAPGDGNDTYENGFIVLLEPSWYFTTADPDLQMEARGLELGVNALLIFRHRSDWDRFRPRTGRLANGKPFVVAKSRSAPLGGVYFARIHATVAHNGGSRIEGFNTSRLRGAGIRVYEYASAATILQARLQLECLMWLCRDAPEQMVTAGMSVADADRRRAAQLTEAARNHLLDYGRLITLRMVNVNLHTICPLCMKTMSAGEFLRRSVQAPGRETHDLTTTEASLFHIEELRVGSHQHKPYNLAWGHHFCNVVVKDAGILPTLAWMREVVAAQPVPDFAPPNQ
jgi:BstXI restriction endonuclease